MALPRLSLKSTNFQADFFSHSWTAAEKEKLPKCLLHKKLYKKVFFVTLILLTGT